MKRGTKLFTYLFISLLSVLGMSILCAPKANAATEYVCYERAWAYDMNSRIPCSATTEEGYLAIKRHEVSITETDVVLPSSATYNGTSYPIEEILSNAIVVTDGTEVNLNSLTLPQSLIYLANNSLNNIASLENLIFPENLMYVGSKIFDDSIEIKTITLNHYSVSYETAPDGPIINRAIEFTSDSLSNIVLERFICGDLDIYDNVKSKVVDKGYLQNVHVTAKVEYHFYNSKKAVETSTPILEKDYYIDEFIADLPDLGVIPTGLNMTGWYWNNNLMAEDGTKKVEYHKGVYVFKIYPEFELKTLTFDISANETSARYNSQADLITLEPINITHELNGVTGFEKEIVWNNGKANLTTPDNIVRLANVDQSGTYKCTITYTYTYADIEYTGTVEHTQTVEITKAILYVDVDGITSEYGTYLSDDNVTFDTVGLIGTDIINNSVFSYHKEGNIEVGTYLNEIKVEIKSILNGNGENVIDNYNIIYKHGTHTVCKKDLGVLKVENDVEFSYGDENAYASKIIQEIAYGTYANTVVIKFSRMNGNNIGHYKVTGIASISDSNYTATFDEESTGYVDIVSKVVDINYILSGNVYTGKAKKVDIYYVDVTGVKVFVDAVFEYEGKTVDEIIEAGTYTVKVTSTPDPNYIISNQTSLTIDIAKATPVVRYATEQEFVYTGEVIRPVISINNSEQSGQPYYTCINSYGQQGEYCQEVGVYAVNVSYPATKNYYAYSTQSSQPIRMSITKYVVNLSPKTFDVYYGETPELEEKITVNGEEMIVKYSTTADNTSDIGSYDIYRANIYHISGNYEHPNYAGRILLVECEDKVNVVPRPVTLHYYDYSGLVYDGEEKIIGAYIFDNLSNTIIRELEIKSVIDEGVVKNAGKYHISSKISDKRYTITNSTLLEFEVEKGRYDLSNVKFEDAKYVLDFKMHSIEIKGKLPAGVEVEYTVNGAAGNSVAAGFENVVVASFIVDLNNYHPIEAMEARIEIDMSWLIIAVICIIIAIGIAICSALLYASYRRDHPKKIKLKIKNVINEDLAAKRVATSVKEVLGDEEEKQKIDAEIAVLESEDDLDDVNAQTFIERIYAASSELKYYYSEVKNELLSYEGIVHSVDRKYEIFYHGTRQVAKLSICNGILRLYVNLEPSKYDKRQYNQRDMSNFECHEKTPLRINVNSLETLRHAKVFIRIIRKKERLESVSGFVRIDYEKFYTLKETFIPKMFKNIFTKDQKDKNSKK